MKDQIRKEYFKKPRKGEFMRICLPVAALLAVWAFLVTPIFRFIEWSIKGSGPFLLFKDLFSLVAYLIFVSVLILWLLKILVNRYNRMQRMPFLVMTKEGMRMDLDISSPLRGGGQIELRWSQIQRVEMQENTFIIHFHKDGKEKSIRADLRWVKEKEDLITTLKTQCQEHHIMWVENPICGPVSFSNGDRYTWKLVEGKYYVLIDEEWVEMPEGWVPGNSLPPGGC